MSFRFFFLLSGFLLTSFFGTFASAQIDNPISLTVKPVYDFVDVDVDGVDFDGSLSLEVAARISLTEQFDFEVSVTGLNEAETDQECDNTGCYTLNINSLESLFGGALNVYERNQFSLFLRGGVLFYKLSVELEETFFDIKPGGLASADDDGFGFYLGAGSKWMLNPKFGLTGEFMYRNRRDVLGDSSKPFDVNSYGVGIGLYWQLQ